MKSTSSVIVAIGFAIGTLSSAATFHVANNGVDGPTCGGEIAPCRSITQAVTNAAPGDTILVGPGLYGELTDGESESYYPGGFFPGEEMPPPAAVARIVVQKTVTILSTNGSAVTFLRDDGRYQAVVQVAASGVVLGGPGQGFSITGNVLLDSATSGVTVSNLVIADGDLTIDGTNHVVVGNVLQQDVDGYEGIWVFGAGHQLHHNRVHGIVNLVGENVQFKENLVVGGETWIEGSAELRRNSFLASPAAGIAVGAVTAVTIAENNFFGNWPPVVPPPGNCGISNYSGSPIDATNNYWGAPSGPGPDPADEACGDEGATTTVTPFSAEPFPIPSPGGGDGGNGSPVCGGALASPSMLWPANGQFVRVWINGVGDPDDDPVAISVTGVTQDEALGGSEAGDTGPDAVLRGSSADIRAQRLAGGNGRVYRLKFSATDGRGGSCSGAVKVEVPNSQKPGQAIIDDGQIYDSLLP